MSGRAWALVFSLALLTACEGAQRPDPRPSDRATRRGERLWRVEVTTPGLGVVEMDRLVAVPVLLALEADPRLDVVGSVARYERLVAYLRAPVHISSVLAVSNAIGPLSLPVGTLLPSFDVAGPHPQEATALVVEIDPEALARHDLGVDDVVRALEADPARSGSQRPLPAAADLGGLDPILDRAGRMRQPFRGG